MTTFYSVLADVVLVVHFGFVAFVVLGLLAVWLGFFLKQNWVRGFRWRIAHLLAMAVVVVESYYKYTCPLTTWEKKLRLAAGEGEFYAESFMQTWIHKIMFFQASQQTFLICYVVFFALLVGSWIIVPPRRRVAKTKVADATK